MDEAEERTPRENMRLVQASCTERTLHGQARNMQPKAEFSLCYCMVMVSKECSVYVSQDGQQVTVLTSLWFFVSPKHNDGHVCEMASHIGGNGIGGCPLKASGEVRRQKNMFFCI